MINSQTFYKIMLLTLFRNSTAESFLVADFLANAAAQYAGYVGVSSLGNQFTPEILLPIIANSKVGLDFIQAAGSKSIAIERATTLSLVFSAAAAVTKTGDIPTNASMGALISAFAQYMAFTVNNSKIPFIVPAFSSPSSIRRIRRMRYMNMMSKKNNGTFTYKSAYSSLSHRRRILKLVLASAGCCVVIYYVSKCLIKAYKRGQLKPLSKRVNNLKNSLINFRKPRPMCTICVIK